jgi:hypothetical protein
MRWGCKGCKDVIVKEMSSLVAGEFVVGIGVRRGLSSAVEGRECVTTVVAIAVLGRLRSFTLLRTPQDDRVISFSAGGRPNGDAYTLRTWGAAVLRPYMTVVEK